MIRYPVAYIVLPLFASWVRPKALQLDLRQYQDQHHHSHYRRLYLNGDIAHADLRLLAQGVIDGKSMAVNAWIDNVLSELVQLGASKATVNRTWFRPIDGSSHEVLA